MINFLKNLLHHENQNEVMRPLFDAITREGRRVEWYEKGQVPDTVDGRFDMIVAFFALVLMRMEKEPDKSDEYVWLSELFVADMDGQLRQIGIGDMVVGKHIGRMMGAVGGRLSAYKNALESGGNLQDALVRNLYRGASPPAEALDFVASKLAAFHKQLNISDIHEIMGGRIPQSL